MCSQQWRSDISLLASQAAIELNDLTLGRPNTKKALQELAKEITSWVEVTPSEPAVLGPYLTHVLLLRNAYRVSALRSVPTQAKELADATIEVAERLRLANASEKLVSLTELQCFCLALSIEAKHFP